MTRRRRLALCLYESICDCGQNVDLQEIEAYENILNASFLYNLAVGFNVETVTFNNLKLQVWDLGGQTGLRPYWRCYYQDTNAVVFVIDSADRERLEIAKQELDLMLQEEELRGAPVLVLANK